MNRKCEELPRLTAKESKMVCSAIENMTRAFTFMRFSGSASLNRVWYIQYVVLCVYLCRS